MWRPVAFQKPAKPPEPPEPQTKPKRQSPSPIRRRAFSLEDGRLRDDRGISRRGLFPGRHRRIPQRKSAESNRMHAVSALQDSIGGLASPCRQAQQQQCPASHPCHTPITGWPGRSMCIPWCEDRAVLLWKSGSLVGHLSPAEVLPPPDE